MRSVKDTLRRIILSTTAAALVIALIADGAGDLFTARRALAEDVATVADITSANSAAAVMFGDHQSGKEILSALHRRESITGACLYAKSGEVFASYLDDYPSAAPPPGIVMSTSRIEITRPIIFKGERIGTLLITSDLRDAHAWLKQYAVAAAMILLAVLAFACTIATRLQRTITDPIRKLSAVVARVRTENNYSLRTGIAHNRHPHEINNLATAVDEMLSEIQQRRRALEEQVQSRTTELRSANAELVEAKESAERMAEETERLSRYKLTVLNTAAEGIFGLDAKGCVTLINASAARMLGYHVDELIGTRLHDFIHDEQNTVPLDECRVCSNVLEATLRTGHDAAFVTREGQRLPVEFTTSTMPAQGITVVTFRDVTEHLAIQRMKDEFVSTVSHELRTPLTSIRGALGLLASGLMGDVSDRSRRMLEIAVANTDRLVRLINEILDLEKMTSGRVELHRTLISAGDMMREAVDVVQSVADRAGVAIFCEPLPNMLWIDRDRIAQTLTNLLGNAVKFSPGGSIVRLSGEVNKSHFTFTVTDQGRGIPAEKLETVFERFKQVDASDSRDKGGSGLGLAICRSIVNAHGGRIWAESAPGFGSIFRFTLPLDLAQRATIVSNAPASVRSGPVLIIEDDADLARVIAATVERDGRQAICAATGAEAIAACRRVVPALIILDVGLPDVDGFRLVHWMRSMAYLERMSMVVYSATDLTIAEQERLRLGSTMFLTKSRAPFSVLESSILALLENRHTEFAGAA